jgi:hypothetical protein
LKTYKAKAEGARVRLGCQAIADCGFGIADLPSDEVNSHKSQSVERAVASRFDTLNLEFTPRCSLPLAILIGFYDYLMHGSKTLADG